MKYTYLFLHFVYFYGLQIFTLYLFSIIFIDFYILLFCFYILSIYSFIYLL